MNGATSLAYARRCRDPRYAEVWFRGHGLDIGCGPDLLQGFPHAVVRGWDMADGDATRLPGVPDHAYDFVYSSHCLEHLENPREALDRWREVLKPGGYLILVVPDFVMYERKIWPSRIQPHGHRTFWTWRDLADMVWHGDEFIRLELLVDGFDPTLPVTVDQTTAPYHAECGIELILRKVR